MVRSVVESRLHTDYRITCQRSLEHGFLKSLLNSREVVLRNRTADYRLFEDIRRIKVAELHLDMAVLTVSAGLLLILGVYIGILLNSLTERNLRRLQSNFALVSLKEFAHSNL